MASEGRCAKQISLAVITPTTRPGNLEAMLASILEARGWLELSLRWIIVFDAKKTGGVSLKQQSALDRHPWINCELFAGEGAHGNPQRNRGIALAPAGFLYFLDDDNLMHPNLLRGLVHHTQRLPDRKAFIVAQNRGDGLSRAHPDNVRVGGIDTAQFIVHTDLIAKPWDVDSYLADGLFIEEIFRRVPEAFFFVDEVLAYYNRLR